MKVTYNVVWADDDTAIYNLKNKFTRMALEKAGITLLATATNAEDLESRLLDFKGMVDAVIIDANFNRFKSVPNSERDISGLQYCVMHLLKEFGDDGRKIPFFLYTGRQEEELRKACEDGGELQYFDENGHLFDKNDGTKPLFKKVKAKVNELNTPEFRIRNMYRTEFEAAALIPDATRFLSEGLLYEYDEDKEFEDAQDYFNPARMIVERIVDRCKDSGILPPLNSLNSVGTFLMDGKAESFTLEDQLLMPKPLAYSLRYFLGITQDGSHDVGDLNLSVNNYVRRFKNVNLYRTIMYIAMDLLLWYKDASSRKFEEQPWKCSYIYEGKVSFIRKGTKDIYFTGEYQLEFKEGLAKDVTVGITHAVDSRYPDETLKKFVKKRGYVINS